MKFLVLLAALFIGAEASACGFDCTISSCLSYGRSSVFTGPTEGCESASLEHLDPQNFAHENYRILATELSGGSFLSGSNDESLTTLKCSQTRSTDLTIEEFNAKGVGVDPLAHFSTVAAAWGGGNQQWVDDYIAIRKELGIYGIDREKGAALVAKFDAWPADKKSTDAAKYLRALLGFYTHDYQTAIDNFMALSKHTNSLLARHALYSLGRSHLVASQKDWDGYATDEGDPLQFKRKVDVALAKKAEETFVEFGKRYADDPWAVSAQGLIRRARVLQGDLAGYLKLWNAEIDAELAMGGSSRRRECLQSYFDEVSHMPGPALLGAKSLHPTMWLVRSYYVSRQFPDAKKAEDVAEGYDVAWLKTTPEAELAKLESDKKSFKSHPDLYAWSRAVLLLRIGKADEAYALLQKQPVAKTNGGSLSWVVLNARALMGMKRFDEARKIVTQFVKSHKDNTKKDFTDEAAEFYLATFIEEKNLAGAYVEGLDVPIRKESLVHVARNGFTTAELRSLLANPKLRADLREDIERISVTKHLFTNDYDGYLENQKLVNPKREDFEEVDRAVATLRQTPDDAVSLYRVGAYLNGIEWDAISYAPCAEKKLQSEKLIPPLHYYYKSLEKFAADKKKNPVEADAIAATLRCFKYGNSSRACIYGADQKELSEKEKRALFKRLHSRYPGSQAAKNTPVFW